MDSAEQLTNDKLSDETDARVTSSHIYYPGKHSILSTHFQVRAMFSFRGRDAIEVMTEITREVAKFRPEKKILEAELNSTLLSYGLLKSAHFKCGQQFVTAFKACVFDQDPVHWSSDGLDAQELVHRQFLLLQNSTPQSANDTSTLSRLPLIAILRSENTNKQQRIGRRDLPNFEADKWARMSDIVATAAIICRAKADPFLMKIILGSGNRKFVEAAPSDALWGVRLYANDDLILDENRWRGRNRSGWCFGRAREYLRGDVLTDGEKDGLVDEDEDEDEDGLLNEGENESSHEDTDEDEEELTDHKEMATKVGMTTG